jgi:hypothetical protein
MAARRLAHRTRPAASAVVLLILFPTVASAQEIQLTGPLRGVPVARQLLRDGRFMVAPLGGVAFGDGRRAAAIAGAEALFHPVDELGIGAWAVAQLAAGSVFAPQIVLVPAKGRAPKLFDSVWFPPFDLHLELGAAWAASRRATRLTCGRWAAWG